MIRNLPVFNIINGAGGDRPRLDVTPNSLSVAATESFNDITIVVGYADQTWDYEISYEITALPWIMVTGASKEGDDTCVITVLENTGAARVGYVTFTSDYCANEVVTITQAAM